MVVTERYPTRPLESLQKERELRHKLVKELEDLGSSGGMAVLSEAPPLTLAGLGPFSRRLYGPHWGEAMRDHDMLVRQHEMAEAAGFPSGDMCSVWHRSIAELLQGQDDYDPYSKTHFKAAAIIDYGFCPTIEKISQLAHELTGIPCFTVHIPQEGGQNAIDYLVLELADSIDWLVKTTGKEFHDELFVEAVENWWDHNALRSRVCYACQAVPAPLDYAMVRRLTRSLSVQFGHRREVVDYLEFVVAEVEDRVRDGISAFGIETARLTLENQPFFFNETFLYEVVAPYGAVIIAGSPTYDAAVWHKDPEVVGRWHPTGRVKDMGVVLKTREDALKFLAKAIVEHNPAMWMERLYEKVPEYLQRALDWKCTGALIHLDAGCRTHALGSVEAKRLIEEHGVATMTFEAANSDSRFFDAQRVKREVETFLEVRLGLHRLVTAS